MSEDAAVFDPTAPRVDPPTDGGEAATLLGFLDFLRRSIWLKADGLDAAGLDARLDPSSMTLGGLLKHLAFVEDHWTSHVLAGREYPEPWASAPWESDPDWDWHSAVDDAPETIRALWVDAAARSEHRVAAVLGAGGIETPAARVDRGSGAPITLRWILVHLIEEYARHAGHADLIRESIDGEVGE